MKLCIFSLSGCEGCTVQLLNVLLEDGEFTKHFEIIGPLVNTADIDFCDIAFVDGAAVTVHDVELLREIRRKSRRLIALGACACLGGLIALNELIGIDYGTKLVYVEKPSIELLNEIKPISYVVSIDGEIPGCPPIPEDIKNYLISLIHGKTFRLPDSAVCHECRSRGLRCLLNEGRICLGMVTRAGCGAKCILYGYPCWGCRGPIEEISTDKVLEVVYTNNIDVNRFRDILSLFLSKTKIYRDLRGIR